MRRPLSLVLLVFALAVAGCGGGGNDGGGAKTTATATSGANYAKQLAQTGATLQKTFGDISDQTGSNTSAQQIAARLQKGADAVKASADKFAQITPPAAAKSAHAKLVNGLREIAAQLNTAANAARKGDSKTLATSLQSLLNGAGSKELAAAEVELAKAGLAPKTTTGSSTTP